MTTMGRENGIDVGGTTNGPWKDRQLAWYETLLLWILHLGDVPRNIGIIPDGNRRFAQKAGISVDEGHYAGSETLGLVGTWAKRTGIPNVAIYVFSTHNFHRPAPEVKGIFAEVAHRCETVLSQVGKCQRIGLRIRCAGDLELLPRNLQRLLAKAELATSNNVGKISTACIAYSARHQLTRMASKLAHAAKDGVINAEDITTELIDEYLAIEDVPDISMLMRTSGEARLSDYLLWQSSFACIYFEPKTLPEVNFWDFVKAILRFQLCCKVIRVVKRKQGALSEANVDIGQFLRQRMFLARSQADRLIYLERLARD